MESNLNLYLVERTDYISYDKYDSFIVCCANEQEARETHPEDDSLVFNKEKLCWNETRRYDEKIGNEIGKIYCRGFLSKEHDHNIKTEHSVSCGSWICGCSISHLKIILIGKADSSIKKGIILASFHAG